MSDPQSTVKRALLELRTLRGRLEATEGRLHAPVAVVGMGLRLPGGVEDAAGLEQLLWRGVDAIGDIPTDRWPLESLFDADPDAPGKMSTRFGVPATQSAITVPQMVSPSPFTTACAPPSSCDSSGYSVAWMPPNTTCAPRARASRPTSYPRSALPVWMPMPTTSPG